MTLPADLRSRDRRRHDREILALAVPAFGALVAEPLFLMADSAIVGHLGTPQLAGVGVASAALTTVAGVFVFLAYATTAAVARRIGAGDRRAAVQQGLDGIWLALLLSLGVVALALLLAPWAVSLLGASPTAAPFAVTYLRISSLGLPAMLMVMAATGVLRGLQDTRTPLVVAVGGFAANLGLNVVLVYGAGLGVAGSAWGTVLAQTGMAAVYLVVVVRGARREGAGLRPDPAGIRACAKAGGPLMVRTLSLRAVLMIATAVAARLGDDQIAGHQIAMTLWIFMAFALDAIAIAGQAIVGRYLGAGDVPGTRAATRRMVEWGVGCGVLLGLLLVVARPLYVPLFTPDPAVQAQLDDVLLLVALSQPAAGVVFVLDGVLMGAGDGTYLAWAMLGTLVAFVPAALAVPALGLGLTGLWWAMNLFMLVRGAFLCGRARSGKWLVTGAVRA
ncbi:MATE family efflux transporter [Kitasatospora herbaricolor]|uniref:MATE family efflux transporter n=1 Tax=Kitasatospora herbaricolor TaxID=68217 RepID=UPI00174A409C|nr:MATE family efflux transporter [Kitasatospora herbaricolor]MDQ0309614.1 putative MATE family efflux protein [Kitasatospora herbaricolor]GGV00700.1 MATE family efflux transporter [Kitasatospora herbaricolor]